ncbi:DUF4301 family protein [Alkalibacterium kapii]|uniref:DUF4301 domain-containing protein n=1 Tax=Alkalibacterium kapii TaxID=426704 RepID=A0A511AUF2_9LACT|nr:DUF4301 family protein [Alkalibacterium kapii]GEK90973.1 hypothetical protein AKA01nite_05950 [Alkalibacterium kapii]
MSIEKFKKGTPSVDITRAVTKEDFEQPSEVSKEYLKQKCVKFIPASGAATRMFKALYTFLEDEKETDFVMRFIDHLEEFAFYEEIEKAMAPETIDKETHEGRLAIVRALLEGELNYGFYPKALIEMHRYDWGTTTPIDEHIYEGEQYLNEDNVELHFTIAKEHEKMFNDYVDPLMEKNEHLNISYSFQSPETDTIAVDMDNEPFKLENGETLYRPGGHGALLQNLNALDADIIFIKNIDNVCHRSQIEDTIHSKKELASLGVEVKKKIDQYIEDLMSDDYDLKEINDFINDTLTIHFKDELTKEKALAFLNRPLRVCGMVQNQGEPGGGPFVVDNGRFTDLQICEKSEIDLNDEEKVEILNNSEFFNPVDLVCFVRDYKGDKFDLSKYANEDRYFISEKTHEGRPLKALEHPGLWNGSMDNWNTLFVEVPITTFNPVKNVNDLLRKGHRKSK